MRAAPALAPTPILAFVPTTPIAAHGPINGGSTGADATLRTQSLTAEGAPTSASEPPLPVPATQVIYKREHDPTERLPLTYREYVFTVARGVDEAAGERLLRAQLGLVRASIAGARPGKFVNLAVFDTVFQGRPPVPPLATLAWKDWRGEPEVAFPRSGRDLSQVPASSRPGPPPVAPPPPPEAPLAMPPSAAPARPPPAPFAPAFAPPASALPSQRPPSASPPQAPPPQSSAAHQALAIASFTAPSFAAPSVGAPAAPFPAPATLAAVPSPGVPSAYPPSAYPAPPPASPVSPPPASVPAAFAGAPAVAAPPTVASAPAPATFQPPPPSIHPDPFGTGVAPLPRGVPVPPAPPLAPDHAARSAAPAPVFADRSAPVPPEPSLTASRPPATAGVASSPAGPFAEPPAHPFAPAFPAPAAPSLAAPLLAAQALPAASSAAVRRTQDGRATGRHTPLPSRPSFRSLTGAARPSGDELIASLFESMHDLNFARDVIEGGDYVLSLALDMIPSQAALLHLYDIDRREYVVACVAGTGADGLLNMRHAEGDPLLSGAMRKRRAVVFTDARAEESATSSERYAALGGARSAIIAPVLKGGRFLGVIEILNPQDGVGFTEEEGNAIDYIAEQFGEFVAAQGMQLDPGRISRTVPPMG